jgi:hypothetical protein
MIVMSIKNLKTKQSCTLHNVNGWPYSHLDVYRGLLRDVKHSIEQAELNLYNTPNKKAFIHNINIAIRHLKACR